MSSYLSADKTAGQQAVSMDVVSDLGPRYSTNDLARIVGCGRKAIRRLQALGIIEPPLRARRPSYDNGTVRRVRLVLALREAGFSLAKIGELLRAREDAAGPGDTAERVAETVADAARIVTQQIEELIRVRRQLVEARESLIRCRGCPRPAEACQGCVEDGRLDPLARTLLLAG